MCCSNVLCPIRTLSLENLLIPNQLVLHLFAHLEKGPPPVTTPSAIKGKITTTVVGSTSNSATYGISTNAARIQIGPYTRFQLGVVKMQIGVIGQRLSSRGNVPTRSSEGCPMEEAHFVRVRSKIQNDVPRGITLHSPSNVLIL